MSAPLTRQLICHGLVSSRLLNPVVATSSIRFFIIDDNVPEEVKQERANEIMELQSQISWELNQEKIGKTFKVVVDRKEGDYFVGRTEFDSPDVDNEVLIDASKTYLKTGEFATVIITDAADFDLYAEAVKNVNL